MTRNNKKRGFTIVELVIVIAVIAILAAVLIPTYANLVKKANEAKAQAEAKNLITEMLADILLGKEGDADLLVFSEKGSDVYAYGYSRAEGRIIAYKNNPTAKADTFENTVQSILTAMVNDNTIKDCNVAEDDWRNPEKIKTVVNELHTKGTMIVYANYEIITGMFADVPAMTVNGVAYDDLKTAIKNAPAGSTITLNRSDNLKFATEEATTLKDITFKAAKGVEINGLKLVGGKGKLLELSNITFENITFTDQVVLGQDNSSSGLSRCKNISFKNCHFDLKNSEAEYKDAIYRGAVSAPETDAYLYGLNIENCTFENCRYAVKLGSARNVKIENCEFNNCTTATLMFMNIAGDLMIVDNNATNTKGMLQINTVGNNYTTSDITTNIIIKNNTATKMTCPNGEVFATAYDNGRKAGKTTYTIEGNSCTYDKAYDEPLNGFSIQRNYGPSVKEFIPNK